MDFIRVEGNRPARRVQIQPAMGATTTMASG
jgi:hypothetical protein